jgi:hypothetical protein
VYDAADAPELRRACRAAATACNFVRVRGLKGMQAKPIQEKTMQTMRRIRENPWVQQQEGKMGYALAWLLGVPIPVLVLVYLLRGCN